MSLNVNILPVFEQLGLYDDLSFTSPGMYIHNKNLSLIECPHSPSSLDIEFRSRS